MMQISFQKLFSTYICALMKNLVAILLLLIYSFSSMGMTLHFHYCCGKIDKIDFTPVKKDGCPYAKHLDNKSCCDNKTVDLKIKDSYQNDAVVKSVAKPLTADKNIDHELISVALLASTDVSGSANSSPPLERLVSFQQLYCIYRL